MICLLHRTKIDANRSRTAATEPSAQDGPPNPADHVWISYHGRIAAAVRAALASHGRYLLADLHGQSHRPATELGYLLTTDDLQLPDDLLDADPALVHKCSLGSLAHNLPLGSAATRPPTLSQLVRGPFSLGALIGSRWDGAACLPSPECRRPQPGETYFWGAYTCAAHSRGLGWAAGATTAEDRAVGAAHDAALRLGAAVQIEVAPRRARRAPPPRPKCPTPLPAPRGVRPSACARACSRSPLRLRPASFPALQKAAAPAPQVERAAREDPAARRRFGAALAAALADFLAAHLGPSTLRPAAAVVVVGGPR